MLNNPVHGIDGKSTFSVSDKALCHVSIVRNNDCLATAGPPTEIMLETESVESAKGEYLRFVFLFSSSILIIYLQTRFFVRSIFSRFPFANNIYSFSCFVRQVK